MWECHVVWTPDCLPYVLVTRLPPQEQHWLEREGSPKTALQTLQTTSYHIYNSSKRPTIILINPPLKSCSNLPFSRQLLKMVVTKSQCPAHTRTPWGKSTHEYDPRIRYLAMGLLLFLFLAVIVCSVIFLVSFANEMKGDEHSG